MKLSEENKGDVLILRVQESRVDSSISSDFKTELLRILEQEKFHNLLVDLQEVDYVDSSGLGALLFGHRHAQSRSGSLKIMHLKPKVQTLLKIANLEEILESFDSEEEAVASF